MRADTHMKVSLGGYSDRRDKLSRELVLYFITSPTGKVMSHAEDFGQQCFAEDIMQNIVHVCVRVCTIAI